MISANILDVNSSEDNSKARKVLSVSENHGKKFWILETGATYYMRLHKHWFADYRHMCGIVYHGDDQTLFVDGNGGIKLRMFNGVVRTIECLHVPKMKRNL